MNIGKTYFLGDIKVWVKPAAKRDKLMIICSNKYFRSSFEISTYEYTYYRHLLHKKITNLFEQARDQD